MNSHQNRTHPPLGLVYDERMCRHSTPNNEPHPECPQRIRAIWNKLQSAGIPDRCVVFDAKKAEDKFIELVHTKKHIDLIKRISSRGYDWQRSKIAARFNSIYFNGGSSESAYLAAGSVVEVSERVAKGELSAAVAIVRPPGHHAEPDEAMGFCLFNNVAIAANFLVHEKPELGIRKILIVDWDVHHGNGTQKMFWNDPQVLFFSVHRFDNGTFYPTGNDGSYSMIGEGLGAGYNINVPWEHGQCGDADYLAVWDHILIPVAKSYNPDMILISGGFDAAIGDPLGGCRVTPYGYSVMMKKLMKFAQGKIVMALEGGYNLDSLANSVLACVEALLEEKPVIGSSEAYPFESTWRVIQAVRKKLSPFWPVFSKELPWNIVIESNKIIPSVSCKAASTWKPLSYFRTIICTKLQKMGCLCSSSRTRQVPTWSSSSGSDAENHEEIVNEAESLETSLETVNADAAHDLLLSLSELKVDEGQRGKKVTSSHLLQNEEIPLVSEDGYNGSTTSWRSVLSKVEIWYASFGSNMWRQRFLCYIEGGMVEGMQKTCAGSRDKSTPQEVMWKIIHHRLFFGQSHTRTWGSGGVAFLHPEKSIDDKAYICMYKITLEQFNDLLVQENCPSYNMSSPLLDLSAVTFVTKNASTLLGALKDGWYSNVVCLGTEGNIPILTITCSHSYIEDFKSGELPMCPPSKEYMMTLVKGLVEGKQLSQDEAVAYINGAASKPL